MNNNCFKKQISINSFFYLFVFLIGVLIIKIFFQEDGFIEGIGGSLLGVCGGVMTQWIHDQSLHSDQDRFFKVYFLSTGIKLSLLVALIVFLNRLFVFKIESFILAFFIAYFILLIYDVFRLNSLSIKRNQ